MAVSELKKWNKKAFEAIIPVYQYLSIKANALGAFDVYTSTEDGDCRVSMKRQTCSAKVCPTGSDFVCDVDIAVRKALSKPEQEYFKVMYSGPRFMDVDDWPLDSSSDVLRKLDKSVRDKVGQKLKAHGIWPLAEYARERDVR